MLVSAPNLFLPFRLVEAAAGGAGRGRARPPRAGGGRPGAGRTSAGWVVPGTLSPAPLTPSIMQRNKAKRPVWCTSKPSLSPRPAFVLNTHFRYTRRDPTVVSGPPVSVGPRVAERSVGGGRTPSSYEPCLARLHVDRSLEPRRPTRTHWNWTGSGTPRVEGVPSHLHE